MSSDRLNRVRLAQLVLGVFVMIALILVRGTHAGDEPVHIVTDWSHHHLIYSTPKSTWDHIRFLSNPRYVQQWSRRNAQSRSDDREWWRWRRAPEGNDTLQNDWSMNMGDFSIVGPNSYPAKYSFNAGTANCLTPAPPAGQLPDFVAFNTSNSGFSGQASIIAYANLYSGTCTGAVPRTYWAYNTAGAILTSVALSGDGKQLAFVQILNADDNEYLTVLKWAQGSGTATLPTTPTLVSNASYRSCTAPCMTNILLSGNTFVSNSSPFYDFASGSDTLYVGDDLGVLHKFTGVFNGTPAEDVSGHGWPVTVSSGGGILTTPVYDQGATPATSYIYVGDNLGFFYRVSQATATTTSVVRSGQLGTAGLDDGPIVDSSTGKEYVFVAGNNGSGTAQRIQVVQFPSAFLSGTTGSAVSVSTDSTLLSSPYTNSGAGLYTGTFDNAYYISANGTGHMYVCGTNAGVTSLWRITVTAGILSAPLPGPALATDNSACSPVTEFNNGATDRIFLSVINSGVTGGVINCGANSGCAMSFNVTGGVVPSATSAHAAESGGTSGIIVDGSSGSAGASQVYFAPLNNQACTTSGGTGGCAIQASQSGLN